MDERAYNPGYEIFCSPNSSNFSHIKVTPAIRKTDYMHTIGTYYGNARSYFCGVYRGFGI